MPFKNVPLSQSCPLIPVRPRLEGETGVSSDPDPKSRNRCQIVDFPRQSRNDPNLSHDPFSAGESPEGKRGLSTRFPGLSRSATSSLVDLAFVRVVWHTDAILYRRSIMGVWTDKAIDLLKSVPANSILRERIELLKERIETWEEAFEFRGRELDSVKTENASLRSEVAELKERLAIAELSTDHVEVHGVHFRKDGEGNPTGLPLCPTCHIAISEISSTYNCQKCGYVVRKPPNSKGPVQVFR